jgi:hypothetical protein
MIRASDASRQPNNLIPNNLILVAGNWQPRILVAASELNLPELEAGALSKEPINGCRGEALFG